MTYSDYIKHSLELHLFFDRIMKEHSFFIQATFLEKNKEMGKVANNFQRNFSRILEDVVFLANKNISENLIESGEFVTKNTLTAEKMSSNLSGIDIDTNITLKELNLTSGNSNPNEQLINNISRINRKTLELLGKLI